MLISLDSFEPINPRGFLVVEGVNGAGKSTVIKEIENHLAARGLTTTKTHEPGDTPLGAELRRLLLNSPSIPRTSTAELLLFGADRSEHVEAVIKPALQQKRFVLSDRYLYSTIAFQGYGRGLDHALIERVNAIAAHDTYPDLVILLDIDVHEGLRRTLKRSQTSTTNEQDSFEQEKIDFHQRVRDGFNALAVSRSEAFLRIDAQQPVEKVCSQALAAVDKLILKLSR